MLCVLDATSGGMAVAEVMAEVMAVAEVVDNIVKNPTQTWLTLCSLSAIHSMACKQANGVAHFACALQGLSLARTLQLVSCRNLYTWY